MTLSENSYAQHTSAPLYEKAFDIGAGGASLTRAASDGVLISNPALLPWGSGQARWDGFFFQAAVGDDFVSIAQQAAGGSLTEEQEAALLDEVLAGLPVAVDAVGGAGTAASNYGFGQYNAVSSDIRVKEFGDNNPGPEISVKAHHYIINVFSLAFKMGSWASFGVTGKQLTAKELSVGLPVDPSAAEVDTGSLLLEGTGTGYDVGSLFFWKNRAFDMQLAITKTDVGGLQLGAADTEDNVDTDIADLKETTNIGLAISWHGGGGGIHMAADYRDYEDAYGEALFKKIHLGTRVMWVSKSGLGFGLSTGLYHGSLTAGVIMDLKFLRISAAQYSKEAYNLIGLQKTSYTIINFSIGG